MPTAFSPARLRTCLPDSALRFVVGFSGGLDSTVLLHALYDLLGDLRPATPVCVVHVHHGLHPEADQWSAHCTAICEGLAVPCTVVRVNARPKQGESLEAAARKARYQALGALLEAGDCLLTAHHRDDQAETLLLQLLRGAGLAGLAAMPACRRLGSGGHARPLLDFPRVALKTWADQQGLVWLDDPGNERDDLDRNYLRQTVMPVLHKRWPATAKVLARAARHQAEAMGLLEELAQIDLAKAYGRAGETLSVQVLNTLSPERQRNALRAWIRGQGYLPPSTRRLAAIQQMLSARWDAQAHVAWQGAEVRRYRGDLYLMAPLAPHDPAQVIGWDLVAPLDLPWLGLRLAPQALPVQINGPVTVRFRQGGERIQRRGRLYHESLKKLFQAQGIPPWRRERIPLIYEGEALCCVWKLWAS